ncbi:putative protein-tyrosine phosphatase [Planoprotostelium fungivorum]|uniref:Tyrosine specific protein phosphatases domain-containing protein n=1 Tax=Planoprotostelium fungivorum TaxID=1890364 RepID=A0A2P6NIE1_9EUKA|nr:putative protein-tyrosine phosphatase [Planoprotostelium fungivorum]
MKYKALGVVFFGIAVGYGILSRKVSPVFAWACVSHAIFATAYVLNDYRITCKDRKTGKIPLWNLALLAPVYAELWGVWAIRARFNHDEPIYEEVCDRVYVGRFPFLFGFQVTLDEDLAGQSKKETKEKIDRERTPFPPHVGLIIDLTCEFVEVDALIHNKTYRCLPGLDTSFHTDDDNILEELLYAFDWDLSKGSIYIHCAAGHGRSVLFLALLMVMKGVAQDLPDALRKIKKNRPRCNLSQVHRQVGARLLPRAMDAIRHKPRDMNPWHLK